MNNSPLNFLTFRKDINVHRKNRFLPFGIGKKPRKTLYHQRLKFGKLFFICIITIFIIIIDGLHNSAEELLSNGVDRQHETCNISDFSWSQNYMFEATGNAEYPDKIEKCVWNAGLGSVTEDFKAAQYFSCVIAEDAEAFEKDGNVFVQAYEIENWRLKTYGAKTRLPSPPKKPVAKTKEPELIELSPYGLSECRITAFARLK